MDHLNELLREIPEWLWLATLGLVSTLTVWWRRQSAGLSFFQEATDEQRDELERMMRERIDFLDNEVQRLTEENKVLCEALLCEDDERG
jgi:hypothetical protein